MGTGAVYVTLAGLEDRFNALTTIETGFYFMNMALFVFNAGTLLLQTIRAPCYIWYLWLLTDVQLSVPSPSLATCSGPCQRHFCPTDCSPSFLPVSLENSDIRVRYSPLPLSSLEPSIMLFPRGM